MHYDILSCEVLHHSILKGISVIYFSSPFFCHTFIVSSPILPTTCPMLSLLGALLAAVCHALAQSSDNYFLQPDYQQTYITDSIYGDSQVFKLGSVQEVEFQTSWSQWSLYLGQTLTSSGITDYANHTLYQR
jgi:hypothetical protein